MKFSFYLKKPQSNNSLKLGMKISLFLGIIFLASCGTQSSDSGSAAPSTEPNSAPSSAPSGNTITLTPPSQTPSLPTVVPNITRAELVNASNLAVIQNITDSSTIDLADLSSAFNITITSDDVSNTGSIQMDMSGCASLNRFENNPPFTVASQGADFTSLVLGDCSLTVTPYELPNTAGVVGDSFVVNFTVIDSSSGTPPTPSPSVPDIVSLALVDASNLNVIQAINGGGTIDLNGLPALFNFTVTSADASSTGSVRIDMSGCAALDRHENGAPYTVAQQGVDFTTLATGSCTITATPYQLTDLGGDVGTSFTTNFNVVDTSSQNPGTGSVNAVINPSRTNCASPCTVVFSADKTTAQGLDSHGVWSQLSYHWDFDTDESDTYGSLYDQTYTYVNGDTAFESGHVPLVTKTFLCDTGTCNYTIGMRAQNASGNFDDDFVTISVRSESTEWSAANTICVSNTLSLTSDWTGFEKACPTGATKQSTIPLPDQFDGKLVLLKRGDVFDADDLYETSQYNYFAIQSGQSNYKVSNFGDSTDSFPDLQARVETGIASFRSSGSSVTSIDVTLTDADVSANGWTNNAYFEGLRMAVFNFPESFNHVGIHDIDMDMETAPYTGGNLSFSGGVRCTDHPTFLNCSNVPFPKGGYISKVDIVGSSGAESNTASTLNIGTVGCVMVNFTGIVDSRVRKAGEHNLRVAGWYRFNVMRSFFRGGHHTVNKAKITPRLCVDGNLFSGQWTSRGDLPANWQGDVEGRTRADIYTGTNDDYIHVSRYLSISHNRVGDDNPAAFGTHPGGGKIGTGVREESDGVLAQDFMVSHNIFRSETGLVRPDNGSSALPQDVNMAGQYHTCVDNDYFDADLRCYPSNPFDSWEHRREPAVIAAPSAPTP
ncbi:MAG: hypothetical protein ACRBCI_08800 [Cellvibrionaceae bacterium]